jgi:hypothetical protein
VKNLVEAEEIIKEVEALPIEKREKEIIIDDIRKASHWADVAPDMIELKSPKGIVESIADMQLWGTLASSRVWRLPTKGEKVGEQVIKIYDKIENFLREKKEKIAKKLGEVLGKE